MNRKIPRDAFDHYYVLGEARSFDKVAERCHVSRRAIANLAAKEGWKQRVHELDAQARQRANEKLLETAAQMNERHLKVLKYMQGKAIETIKSMPLESGMDGMRAYLMALNAERLIRGEPTERHENVEAIIKREYERWLVPLDNSKRDDEPDAAPASGTEGTVDGSAAA